MTILSKEVFYKAVEGKTCGDLYHPSIKTCRAEVIEMLRKMSQGTAKFCVALALLQILAKGKDLNREHFKSILVYGLRLFCCGVCMGILFSVGVCFQSKVFGQFYYYAIMSIPGLFSGLSIFLLPKTKRYIFITSMCCAALDTASSLTGRRSIFRKTIVFMVLNSLFMYYLRLWKTNKKKNQATPELWFFSPHHSPVENFPSSNRLQRPCSHIHSCMKSITKETTKYFWCGAAIESARVMVTNFGRVLKNPRNIFRLLCRKSSIQIAVFAATYVFLHKVTNCALCRLHGRNENSNALIAGFVSGFAFYFRPSVTINITLFANLIHVLWRYFNCNDNYLKHFPTSEFLFIISFMFLMHNRIVNPSQTSTFFTKLVSVVSDGRVDLLIDNFMQLMVQKEIILQKCSAV